MKLFKKTLLLVAIIGAFFIAKTGLAAEKINSFDVTIKINQDSSLEIEESINYDFGKASRHGIYREIPIKYRARGGNYGIRISDVSVVNKNNRPYQIRTSARRDYLHIRIFCNLIVKAL